MVTSVSIHAETRRCGEVKVVEKPLIQFIEPKRGSSDSSADALRVSASPRESGAPPFVSMYHRAVSADVATALFVEEL